MGETRDSSDLKLPGLQEELARAILATGKPVVVVLITGRPYALPVLAEEAHAILEAWLPGEEGGAAIADILFGDANPGGKLPITFPRSAGQLPVYYNAKPAGKQSHWYTDYVSEPVIPLYPFGHGLSYTSFEYSDLSIGQKQVRAGGSVDISVHVKNTGPVAGDEIVQLYTYDEFASSPRPARELRGYRRLTLEPGEARTVHFHLPVDQLAFHDANLHLIVEAGTIDVMIGSSSEDIRLCGEFEIVGERKAGIRDRVFVCPVTVE
jgi:beta-glucosidase